jgi:hypothetical protein
MADTLIFGRPLGGFDPPRKNSNEVNMRDEAAKGDNANQQPYSLPGFESEVLSELDRLVSDLPDGTASLHIGRIPGHPERGEPYFEVVPKNPKSARFKGEVVIDDLNLTIGVASFREFFCFGRGGTVFKGARWQEELRWIWLAVIGGGFTETLYRNSNGKVIGWATKLSVNGKDLVIRNGTRLEGFFRSAKRERITYEPYVTARV